MEILQFQLKFHWDLFISIKIWLKLVPEAPIDDKSALVQVMAWCQTGTKPLPEAVVAQFNDKGITKLWYVYCFMIADPMITCW